MKKHLPRVLPKSLSPAKLPPAIGGNHPDALAVDRFAVAMKAKLAQKRAEGRGGWDNPEECSAAELSYLLIQHCFKGDPLDVGNFAMMLQRRGERIVIDDETASMARAALKTSFPKTGTTVPEASTDFTDIVALLDEAHGFAALSPAGRDNIETAIAKLEEARETVYRLGFTDGEQHGQEGADIKARRAEQDALFRIAKELDRLYEEHKCFVLAGQILFDLRQFVRGLYAPAPETKDADHG